MEILSVQSAEPIEWFSW